MGAGDACTKLTRQPSGGATIIDAAATTAPAWLGHFEIPANDPVGLAEFYAGVLGWQARSRPWQGGHYLTLRPRPGDHAPPSSGGGVVQRGTVPFDLPLLVFHVAAGALEETLIRIREAGGEVVASPAAVGAAGRFACFTDPEGHRVGLWEPVGEQPPSIDDGRGRGR